MSGADRPTLGDDRFRWGDPAAATELGWTAALVGCTGVSVGLSAMAVNPTASRGAAGFVAGAASAVLAVVALQSIPARWAARAMVLLGTVVLARFGAVSVVESPPPSIVLTGWLVASVGALAIGVRLDANRSGPPGRGRRGGSLRATAAAALVVAALASSSAMWLAPILAESRPAELAGGDDGGPRVGPDSPLASTESLDMTTRPRLSSRVLFRVSARSDRFWRTETFDRWDGSMWTRSRPQLGIVGSDGTVVAPFDERFVTAQRSVFHQRIEMATSGVVAIPAAATAGSVRASVPVAQRSDGTLVAIARPLGVGGVIDVDSSEVLVDPKILAAATGSPPSGLGRAYTDPGTATARVRALATQLGSGGRSTAAKVQATIDWLGRHTTYTQDAPLAPDGVDVVDDFLFRSREGWCEQIASSLVVLLRLQGVPARLATGFAPGQWDPVTSRYEVRESDAHAWAEVWFTGVGWVPFDPTAAVPPSGTADGRSGTNWLVEHLGTVLLVAAAVVAVARPSVRLVGRALAAVRPGRPRRGSATWTAKAERRLERFGARAGRPRAPSETLTTYGSELSRLTGDRRVAEAGVLVDRARYEPDGDDELRSRAVELVDAIGSGRR